MNTEDLIREIISKICPRHGKHAIVEVCEVGEIDISACCDAFLEQIGNIMNVELQNPFNTAGSLEII